MRDTGLAATEKFLPKGGEHSSAALRRGKAARRGNFRKNGAAKSLFLSCGCNNLVANSLAVLTALRGRGCFLFGSGSLVAFPADADEFGDAGLLHSDAVEDGAGFHGF